jgi:hypothetical protein
MPIKLPLSTRFEQKIQKTDDCWLWVSSIDNIGYGRFCLDRRNAKAHRVAWQLYRGPIENGLFVLHKCDVRNCVNPDHLFLGTQDDNIKDCVRKGRLHMKKRMRMESDYVKQSAVHPAPKQGNQ